MYLKKGFTLIELSLVLFIAMVMASAVVPNFVRSLHIEAARKTALEMSQIAEAGRAYYIEQKQWPDGIDALRTAGFMDNAWGGKNPFGGLYTLARTGSLLEIATTLPGDMAQVAGVLLPMPAVSGTRVSFSVTPPGADALPQTGTIVPWPSAVIPQGWLICDGRPVSRTDYKSLFAVIGTVYGAGDGAGTFNLPDLRGRTVVGLDNMGGGSANVITDLAGRTLGGKFGEEAHRLTVAEMPSHAHGYNESPWFGARYDGHSSPLLTSQRAATTSSAGGDLAHNNLQPSMGLYWIVKS